MDFGRTDYNEFLKRLKVSSEDDLNVLESDEPVFLIRGTDPIAPRLLMMYATELMAEGSNMTVINSVTSHADRFRKYQKLHGTKGADIVREDPDMLVKKIEITSLIDKIEYNNTLPDDLFSKLSDLMDSVYGKGSLISLLPSEVIAAPETLLGLVPKPEVKELVDKAIVVLVAINKTDMRLIKRKGV